MTDRSGFTLVELVMAIVLGALVAGTLYRALVAQARFFAAQSAREEVQQNTRAALELIGSELRTMPGGDALVRAAADSITLRAARTWGVVCAAGGGTSLSIAHPAGAGAGGAVNTGTGLAVNFGSAGEPSWSDGVRVTAVSGPSSTCGGEGMGEQIEVRTYTLGAVPRRGTVTPSPGNVVYVYDQVTYRTGASAGVPGVWIQRRIGDGGASSNQPMAGPVTEEGAGLHFQYFAAGSDVPLTTPISDAAVRGEVKRVMVVVESVSSGRAGGAPATKADTIVIPLRNRV